MLTVFLKRIRMISAINILIRQAVILFSTLSRRLFNFFSKHWPVVGIIRLSLPGGEELKLIANGDDWITTQAFWHGLGGYEGKSEYIFYRMAQGSRIVMDVGANIGYYSLIAAAASPHGRVIAFEPTANVRNRLCQHVDINSLSNIVVEPLVASNKSHPIAFFIPDGDGLGRALAASTKKGWVPTAREVVLPASSLDDYKANKKLGKIDLIKIDCELHELEVLQGMAGILKNDKPAILMEVLFRDSEGVKGHIDFSQSTEIERLMMSYGYSFYLITDSALLRVDALEHNPESRNYLFSPRKTPNRYVSYRDLDCL